MYPQPSLPDKLIVNTLMLNEMNKYIVLTLSYCITVLRYYRNNTFSYNMYAI